MLPSLRITGKTTVKVYIFSLILAFLIIDEAIGGKKDDDDSYEDDDPDCYPGRNCIPGCYCGAEKQCRPYFFPKSPQHGKWQCRPFNYPKWKVYKKGSKDDTTVIVMPHLPYEKYQKFSDISSLLTKRNFTAVDELAADLSQATLKMKYVNHTVLIFDKMDPPMIVEFIPNANNLSSSTISPPSSPSTRRRSKSSEFLRNLHST